MRSWFTAALAGMFTVGVLTVSGQPALKREPFVPRPVDAPIYKRIDKVRDIAAKIKIDGKGGDWDGIPEFGDSSNDTQGDGGRDIVNVAIAPRPDELLVIIETAQLPSQEDLAFWFNVDLFGFQSDDIQIGLAKDGNHALWVFEDGKPGVQTQFRGVEAFIKDVVEVRIPYKLLAEALPMKMRPLLLTDNPRPVVRVSPFTYERGTKRFVDYGPAVASFRLAATPFPLDPPPPKNVKPARSVDLPVNGKWYIGMGAFSPGSHQEVFSYDFYIVDHTGHPSTARESKRNSEYLSWDQPVTAVVAGRVVIVKKDGQDETPRLPNTAKVTDANRVFIDIGDGMGLEYVHFRRNTIAVSAGQSVRAGNHLGNIGNSGQSAWPHLHLALWKTPEGKVTLPLGLANVRVSLNHAGEDPWARDFQTWDIREGYFVERARR